MHDRFASFFVSVQNMKMDILTLTTIILEIMLSEVLR